MVDARQPQKETQMALRPEPFYTGESNLLDPDNHVLLLIDHQPSQFAAVQSHDRTLLLNSTVALAKVAKAFEVPTLLTTIVEDLGGKVVPQLQAVFPDQQSINRTNMNAWEDPRVVDWVRATGRRKVVIAGLWTDICVAFPVLSALGEGYEVYFVTDASGSTSIEAHEMAVQRMIQAGAVPLVWSTYSGELQRDWARMATVPAIQQIAAEHGGVLGSDIAWEMQLLATPAPEWVLAAVGR
jgi:nicotinamidase-related amidase